MCPSLFSVVDADYDYDLNFSGVGGADLKFPAVGNVTDFTLVMYVRYKEGTKGIFLNMCEAK